MSSIAEIGNGRYYETMDPTTVPQIFTRETMQASRSAIKEDLFVTLQTADHPVLAGFNEDELPFTLGYVMTEAKPTAQVLLTLETGDPLLAISRYGLGVGMAYTSDLTEKWGGEWLAWQFGGKFWAQTFKAVLRKADVEGMHISQQITSSKWIIDIIRRDRASRPVSSINWDGRCLDALATSSKGFSIAETGLGRYSVEVPLTGKESMSLRLHDLDHDKLMVLHYHRPYPPEYNLSEKDIPAFKQLGEFQPQSIRADITPARQRKSISHYAYMAGLTVLLVGIFLRRI
jgi:hypothetical protein